LDFFSIVNSENVTRYLLTLRNGKESSIATVWILPGVGTQRAEIRQATESD
jgi:hypothetical protein